jgi:hypothetical protein
MKPIIIVGGVLQIKAADGSKQRKFDIVAYDGGKLNLGNFDLPVVVDIATTDFNGVIPLLIDHDTDTESTLGQVVSVEAAGGEIHIRGIVTGESPKAKQVLAQADNKHRFHASIGVRDGQVREVGPGQTITANGKVQTGPLYLVSHGRLNEVSVVGLGGSNGTKVNLAAAAASMKGNAMSFEEWCASMGIDPATATEAGRALLEGAYKHAMGGEESPNVAAMAEEKPVEEKPVTAAHGVPSFLKGHKKPLGNDTSEIDHAGAMHRLRLSAAEEIERVNEISKITRDNITIQAAAVKNGWSVDYTELQVRRARDKQAPSNALGQSSELDSTMIEAALCATAGLANVEAAFGQQVVESARKQYRKGLSLQEVLAVSARQKGWHGDSVRSDLEGALRAAFPPRNSVQASFGTVSLPGILSNTANKFLMEGFNSVEDSWRRIAAIGSVTNYQQQSKYRLTGGFTFEEVGPAGEIRMGTIGEETLTNQAKIFAKMFAITERDMVNDDLGAFTTVPRGIGRGGALGLNEGFWKEFLADHGTFFTTGRKNYTSGGSSALSIDSLTTVEKMFLEQVDADGNPLALSPALLLVPPALNVTASTLMRSAEVRNTTASTKEPTINPHQGKFDVVYSTYLNNAKIGNASNTGWYMLASPSDMAMIEVVFLNGQQTPTVEQADADFNTLGIQMRGTFRYGIKKQDYRAAVKSNGA